MKYLLDTHTLIWYLDGDDILPKKLGSLIENSSELVYVSAVSFWEIAIKVSLGKLTIDMTINELYKLVLLNDFKLLPLKSEHTFALIDLPFIHRDPFDRALIAQSMFEHLIIISKDEFFTEYQKVSNTSTIWD